MRVGRWLVGCGFFHGFDMFLLYFGNFSFVIFCSFFVRFNIIGVKCELAGGWKVVCFYCFILVIFILVFYALSL